MKLGFFYDFDLTLTEEFQQYPIFRKHADELNKKYGITKPEQYWKLCARSELGVSWMEQMIKDTPEVFGSLTNESLEKEFAPQIALSSGIPSWFGNINHYIHEKLQENIQHHIISVGVTPLVKGTAVSRFVNSISAGEFIDDGEGICRIKSILFPFRKVEMIKRICKGADLYSDVEWNSYNINHRDSFVFGDGQSDMDMFRYIFQRGGVPVAVFEKGNLQAYEKAVKLLGSSVTIIAPRDYTEGSTLDGLVKETLSIMKDAEDKCDMDPEPVHNYRLGHIKNASLIKTIESHLSGCKYCQEHGKKRFYSS